MHWWISKKEAYVLLNEHVSKGKNKADQNSASAQEMFRVLSLCPAFSLSSRDILDSA